MYLEVKDIKKSYGEGGSYIQVLRESVFLLKRERCA